MYVYICSEEQETEMNDRGDMFDDGEDEYYSEQEKNNYEREHDDEQGNNNNEVQENDDGNEKQSDEEEENDDDDDEEEETHDDEDLEKRYITKKIEKHIPVAIYFLLFFVSHLRAENMQLLWKQKYKEVKIVEFTQPTGPTTSLPTNPLEIFFCFFTQQLIRMIVDQSNLYAASCMGEELYQRWEKITDDELKAYLGFIILMGLVPLPSIYDYWCKNPVFHYSPIADRISRDRFLEIHKYLHFVDNETLPAYGDDEYDKLGKVRPLVDYLCERFLKMYNPHCQISIDEAMIKFKGRSSMKQYMPKKPVKRGFKVWVRADSTNGYISELEIYVGKKGNKTEHGLGRKVVESLTEKLAGKHHHVYFDNYFSSIPLFLSLAKRDLYGCGTLISNRKGFPPQLRPKLKKGLKNRGDSIVLQNKNLVISLWQDTKPVLVISSNTQPTAKTMVTRKKCDGSTVTLQCPQSVKSYNTYMGGVDLNDQLRNYYNFRVKSRKSYKYIFFLFQLSITNSYILTKHYTDSNIYNMKQFRQNLATLLIRSYHSRKRPGRPQLSSGPSKRPQLSHFPYKGDTKVHKCYYCTHTRKQRHETVWYCRECGIFLCHQGSDDDCFYKYHKKL